MNPKLTGQSLVWQERKVIMFINVYVIDITFWLLITVQWRTEVIYSKIHLYVNSSQDTKETFRIDKQDQGLNKNKQA